ncbi:hypothetical protein D0Y65_026486 [Glycine soja]|uniref:Reverse transcriptase domain-containing protein n=1 Tax=Glycine soja TaxID=3848 RepID=A0A445IK76_GLYSO|nr:hypothetical protein D0Y65_026486 [Glycine soja]
MIVYNGAPRVFDLLFADDCLLFFKASKLECEKMMEIIKTYELASGQAINLQKSNVIFSRNVQQLDRGEILEVLGVQEGNSNGKYLGLPAIIGRSHHPSYVWRSIYACQILLKGGLRWSIGSGANINVWGEPWLRNNGTTLPISGS